MPGRRSATIQSVEAQPKRITHWQVLMVSLSCLAICFALGGQYAFGYLLIGAALICAVPYMREVLRQDRLKRDVRRGIRCARCGQLWPQGQVTCPECGHTRDPAASSK